MSAWKGAEGPLLPCALRYAWRRRLEGCVRGGRPWSEHFPCPLRGPCRRFDGYVTSYQARSYKPEEGIYRAAEALAGAAGPDLCFIDDKVRSRI